MLSLIIEVLALASSVMTAEERGVVIASSTASVCDGENKPLSWPGIVIASMKTGVNSDVTSLVVVLAIEEVRGRGDEGRREGEGKMVVRGS